LLSFFKDSESVVPAKSFVNAQKNIVDINNDLESLSFNDFLEIIRVLLEYILSKKRYIINKNACLYEAGMFRKLFINLKKERGLKKHLHSRKKVPP
jgi:hypothetical protein